MPKQRPSKYRSHKLGGEVRQIHFSEEVIEIMRMNAIDRDVSETVAYEDMMRRALGLRPYEEEVKFREEAEKLEQRRRFFANKAARAEEARRVADRVKEERRIIEAGPLLPIDHPDYDPNHPAVLRAEREAREAAAAAEAAKAKRLRRLSFDYDPEEDEEVALAVAD